MRFEDLPPGVTDMATTGGIRVVVTTLFAAAVLGACTTAAATPTDFVDVPASA